MPLLICGPGIFRTCTSPVVAAFGTFTVMLVSVQFTMVPFLFGWNLTWSPCCRVPNPVPVTTNCVCTGPHVRDSDVITGPVCTVNASALLGVPAVLTVTVPAPGVAVGGTTAAMAVSVQLLMAAAAPLIVTVPVAGPNPCPVNVTGVSTPPEAGDTCVSCARVHVPRSCQPLAAPL